MNIKRLNLLGAFVGVASFMLCNPALAESIITANCTGMMDLEIYNFNPAEELQVVPGYGEVKLVLSEEFITLSGEFGQKRFDLKAGTLYFNDSDTGLYCTYKGLK